MSLIQEAESFAREVHKGQTRNNTARTPLIDHIADVVRMLEAAECSEIEIAAGWLHDAVEDTDTTLDQIAGLFGPEIGAIVDGLTDPPEFAHLHQGERKWRQALRILKKSWSVKRVKIADQTSNILSLADPPLHWSPQTAYDYLEGAAKIVDACYGANLKLELEFCEAFKTIRGLYYRRYGDQLILPR